MGIYLDKIVDWEAFGYQLLPEDKEHLMEVIIKAALNVLPFMKHVLPVSGVQLLLLMCWPTATLSHL